SFNRPFAASLSLQLKLSHSFVLFGSLMILSENLQADLACIALWLWFSRAGSQIYQRYVVRSNPIRSVGSVDSVYTSTHPVVVVGLRRGFCSGSVVASPSPAGLRLLCFSWTDLEHLTLSQLASAHNCGRMQFNARLRSASHWFGSSGSA